MRSISGIASLFVLLSAPFPSSAQSTGEAAPHVHHEGLILNAAPYSSSSLYPLQSRWTDGAEKSVQLKDFQGRPVVVAMFYASCTVACPVIVENVQRIERAAARAGLAAKPHFILVTFDPEHDSASELKRYAESRGLAPERWSLVRGTPDDTRELAVLLGARYKRNDDGTFAHSNLITLFNGRGEIAYRHEGLRFSPDDLQAFVDKLMKER